MGSTFQLVYRKPRSHFVHLCSANQARQLNIKAQICTASWIPSMIEVTQVTQAVLRELQNYTLSLRLPCDAGDQTWVNCMQDIYLNPYTSSWACDPSSFPQYLPWLLTWLKVNPVSLASIIFKITFKISPHHFGFIFGSFKVMPRDFIPALTYHKQKSILWLSTFSQHPPPIFIFSDKTQWG